MAGERWRVPCELAGFLLLVWGHLRRSRWIDDRRRGSTFRLFRSGSQAHGSISSPLPRAFPPLRCRRRALSDLLLASLFWLSHHYGFQPSLLMSQVLYFSFAGLFLVVLSHFALAMPALILDDCRLAQALFRSDELTEGKWIVLAILLAKSLIGGYVAGMLPFWLAGWLWPYLRLPLWSLSIASVAAVIAVEPYMFIGFAMMYTMRSTPPSTHTSALAQQFA